MIFPEEKNPLVSIIILLHNKSRLTKKCLESIYKNADVPYELIIINNNSTDGTSALLSVTKNAKIINNTDNKFFVRGCNQGAEIASGKYLLFLNNDTEILPKCLSSLVDTIEGTPKCGAVGGMLIFPNGTLQEAGAVVWNNGHCNSIGRNDYPGNPSFNFTREVDYCSGALLLTPKKVFKKMGGFDDRFSPAYFEDVDYCMSLKANGYKTIYQPLSKIIHHEYGSSDKGFAEELMKKNHSTFKEKWKDELKSHKDPGEKLQHLFGIDSKKVLFIDDKIPNPKLGSGFPRSFDMLMSLKNMGMDVTFIPLQNPRKDTETSYKLQQKGVEVIYSNKKIDIDNFLSARANSYDFILVSRPHNMSDSLVAIKKHIPNIPIIYDAEAIFSLREKKKIAFDKNATSSQSAIDNMFLSEITLAKSADHVTSVSNNEGQIFLENGCGSVSTLGFQLKANKTENSFHDRKDILFIGSIRPGTPNEDSLLYFCKEIFPSILKKQKCNLIIAGTNTSESVKALESENIKVLGRVNDLNTLYNKCRLFIIPTRYAAGIPYKYYEAASMGIPCIVSSLIGDQIEGKNNQDCLIADSKKDFIKKTIAVYNNENLWNEIRNGALEKIKNECSADLFERNLLNALKTAESNKKKSVT